MLYISDFEFEFEFEHESNYFNSYSLFDASRFATFIAHFHCS